MLNERALPVNMDKLTPSTKCLTCLATEVDIDNNTMRIHPDKLFEIYEECLKVSRKTYLSRRASQSLLGKLL